MRQPLRRRDDEDLNTLHRKVLAYEVDSRRLIAELAEARRRKFRDAALLSELRDFAAALNRYTDAIDRTRIWKIVNLMRRLVRRPSSLERPLLESREEAPLDDYAIWLAANAPRAIDLERMRMCAPFLKLRPIFSIVMPIYNTPERYLRAAIESVLAQAYPYWQLCAVDDASPAEHVAPVIAEYATRDERIIVRHRAANGHIVAASNDALELATGEFIGLLDHDDVLQPDALYENAIAINARPDVDMLYSDEDKIGEDGQRLGPFFKPDWSPDTFLTKMYTSHFGVYRRSLVESIGAFRAGFDGAQDYDLVLRISERTTRIEHIAKILYSWRLHAASTSLNSDSKDYAYANSQRALQDALDRRQEGGSVAPARAGAGHWQVRYAIRSFDKVSLIVPTRNGANDVKRCLDSIFGRTDYPDYEVILLDNGSDRKDALDLFRAYMCDEPLRMKYVRHDVPFNYSEINNVAVSHAKGSYFLFLNNDTEVIDGSWMRSLVEYAQRPSIGAVGAKLIYGNGSIQHAGVVLGIQGIAGHSHRHAGRYDGGYGNSLVLATNYSAVTAACMMVRRDAFIEAGGFDETLAIAYNDVDLCLRLRERGLYNVYLPHVELLHFESQSRGYDVEVGQVERDLRERVLLQARWQQAWSQDPFYNRHLTLDYEDFRLAT